MQSVLTGEGLLRRTPLHRALYWGNIGAAARLLEAGASVHVADHKVPGLPPSHTAVCLACNFSLREARVGPVDISMEWHCLEYDTFTPAWNAQVG